jgi:hypothetical protein
MNRTSLIAFKTLILVQKSENGQKERSSYEDFKHFGEFSVIGF